MSGTTRTVNVNQFKCVPLDLIKNIDESGNIKVEVTSNDLSLKKINDETQDDIAAAGQINADGFNANKVRNFIIIGVVTGVIIFTVILNFIGWRNLRNFTQHPKYFYILLGVLIAGILSGLGYGAFLLGKVIREAIDKK